jgi:23S rRNA (cytidine1920-2'-O)/16S rRNA (cytidine1409-2'-O)-methyltransferase
MDRIRLDQALVNKKLVRTRSQAEGYIKLGTVMVNDHIVSKPGRLIWPQDIIQLTITEHYVSRGALKLDSVTDRLKLDFHNKVVLDVGSSTGGFSEYSLRHGAKKVIAIDVGKDQLHASLRDHPRIELHEKTDIRKISQLSELVDLVLVDVSFISVRPILSHISKLVQPKTIVIAMVKPQFEVKSDLKHKGVVKNDSLRRDILHKFEIWAQSYGWFIEAKADSTVVGAKGNQERFYRLKRDPKRI